MIQTSQKSLACTIDTIGKKGVHYPWRVCSYCGGNIEDVPDECPYCGAKVLGYRDKYIRRVRVNAQ